jgi:hypothetical protein
VEKRRLRVDPVKFNSLKKASLSNWPLLPPAKAAWVGFTEGNFVDVVWPVT